MGELIGLIRKIRKALEDGGLSVREVRALLRDVLDLWDQIDRPGGPVVVGDLDPTELDDADVDALLLEYGTVSAASTDAEAIPPGLAFKLIKWGAVAAAKLLIKVLAK